MSSLETLTLRNRAFARTFSHGDLAGLPKLGTLILSCIDTRVDPAHVLGLNLGDAVVFRNNGGRVTPAFIDEVAALSLLIPRISGAPDVSFTIVLMQHTKCGAQHFADPVLQAQIAERFGVDVSACAITDPRQDLVTDIHRLRDATDLPGGIHVAALLYDVDTGTVREIAPAVSLSDLRTVTKEA